MRPSDTAREIAEALYDCGRMPLTGASHREASVAIGVERIMRLVGWQPIATAPKEEVLDVWMPAKNSRSAGTERGAYWCDSTDRWLNCEKICCTGCKTMAMKHRRLLQRQPSRCY